MPKRRRLRSLTLRIAASFSGSGSSAGNISSTTATWNYDTVTGLLTEVGGLFNVRYTIAPLTTLFRHTSTGMVLGAPAATATTFSCVEGNFFNESTVSWGPGTATARTVGGDDIPLGPAGAGFGLFGLFGFLTGAHLR